MIAGSFRYMLGNRFIHTRAALRAVDKGLLGKLRKNTGFSISKCKNALEQFENDISKAESWLKEQAQKEGWAKANKLRGRHMSQGLISMIVEKDSAAMVEMNCETDFVARNDKFQKLISQATATCFTHGQRGGHGKTLYSKADLGKLMTDGSTSLADIVALEVGNIGENIQLQRGVFCKSNSNAHIGTYIHSTGPAKSKDHKCIMGKYGSIVIFQQSGDASCSVEEMGRQLCQHIVGMNPAKIGTSEDKRAQDRESETCMFHQEFLLDPDLTVGEYLEQNGASVIDFVRFECGESDSNEEDQKS